MPSRSTDCGGIVVLDAFSPDLGKTCRSFLGYDLAMLPGDPIHVCNPHKLVTSHDSKKRIEEQMKDSSPKVTKQPRWILPAITVAIVAFLVLGLFYVLSYLHVPWAVKWLAGLPDESPQLLAYFLALLGTVLGAIGAAGSLFPDAARKKSKAETARDVFALFGWSCLVVSAILVLWLGF